MLEKSASSSFEQQFSSGFHRCSYLLVTFLNLHPSGSLPLATGVSLIFSPLSLNLLLLFMICLILVDEEVLEGPSIIAFLCGRSTSNLLSGYAICNLPCSNNISEALSSQSAAGLLDCLGNYRSRACCSVDTCCFRYAVLCFRFSTFLLRKQQLDDSL